MSKNLPLPEGYEYAAALFPAEARHEDLLYRPIKVELTPELDCCALCCIHDEQHEMYPGLEHGEC